VDFLTSSVDKIFWGLALSRQSINDFLASFSSRKANVASVHLLCSNEEQLQVLSSSLAQFPQHALLSTFLILPRPEHLLPRNMAFDKINIEEHST